MDKLQIVKGLVGSVVAGGVSKIVHDIIANNTSPEKLVDKVPVYIGAGVLGMMAKDLSKAYTSDKIDKYIATWKKVQAKLEEASTESETASDKQ